MPFWYGEYFKLKLLSQSNKNTHTPFSPWKQELNVPCESYFMQEYFRDIADLVPDSDNKQILQQSESNEFLAYKSYVYII